VEFPNFIHTSLWDIHQDMPPNPRYTFNRDFPYRGDTIDVIVFVWEVDNGYEVTSSVEARSSGPYDHKEGAAITLTEALAYADTVCKTFNDLYENNRDEAV
jgi:hypothetical protein